MYGTFIPGGVFVPGMIIGACYGRVLGLLLAPTAVFSHVDPSMFALLGAGSMLGGMLHMSLALAVMLIEATNDQQYVVPVTIVVYIANAISSMLTPSLYGTQVKSFVCSLPSFAACAQACV